jgi:hypothetical protein
MFLTKLGHTSNHSVCRGVFAVVHSCRWKFLKHVHNLFTHALGSSSPAGLRLEITHESDKKKMNLIFNFDKKIFLTEKIKGARRCEKKNSCQKNLAQGKSQQLEIAAPDGFRCRSSANAELTELACS